MAEMAAAQKETDDKTKAILTEEQWSRLDEIRLHLLGARAAMDPKIQEEIGLGDRLFLNGGLRVDANSAFGDEVNTEVYPKLGLAYLLSDELFFEDLFGSLVNDFKLRAAYGQTGKFPAPFLRDRSFNASQFRGESAPRFNNPGNVDLAPEVTKTIEAGFDL